MNSSDSLSPLPDEITTTLSYTRPLSIRPLPGASRYWDSGTDLQKVGRELLFINEALIRLLTRDDDSPDV